MTPLATASRAIATLLVLASVTTPIGARAEPVAASTPVIELVSQTATVAVGGTFAAWLRVDAVPGDALIEVVLHGRVRSRSELTASMDRKQLRGEIYRATAPLTSYPTGADGTRRLALSLDPADPGAVALTAAGVYPMTIDVQDATGETLSELVTHLLVRPGRSDTSPPLLVAVVAQVDAAPALQTDGAVRAPVGLLDQISSVVDALTETAEVPATLVIRPELVDALAATEDPAGPALVDRLRGAAAGRAVLSMPYVAASPDALESAGLTGELDEQLRRGDQVLSGALGVDPRRTTWLAGPDLDEAGVQVLAERGVRHLLLEPDRMLPLRSGVVSLSLAQPFDVRADTTPAIDAVALDEGIAQRLGSPVSAGLEVSRVLAELAMLWFEQPGIARGVVVPIDLSVRGSVVRGVLDALALEGPFRAVEVDELFTDVPPLRQPGGGRVDRPLDPGATRPLSASLARELLGVRAAQRSFAGLVGSDSARSRLVDAHLLLATASDLSASQRSAHVDAARAVMDQVTEAISAPERGTITLTARDGTVPLTLRNTTGGPVQVTVHLRSSKLRFPGGNAIALTLSEETTRLDISVSARASGKFPLDVSVTSPDGFIRLASVDYSVQSTAVSGVGLVLSIGAAIFLLVWWARHWHRTRRSAKLVDHEAPTPD